MLDKINFILFFARRERVALHCRAVNFSLPSTFFSWHKLKKMKIFQNTKSY